MRSLRRKILFLTTLLPYPADSGGKIKTLQTLKVLGSFADVDLVCFVDRAADAQAAHGLRTWVQSTVTVEKSVLLHDRPLQTVREIARSLVSGLPYVISKFDSGPMREAVRAALARTDYDTVVIDHLQMFQYAPLAELRKKAVRLVLEEHNVETEIVRRYRGVARNLVAKLFASLELAKLERYEKAACLAATTVLAITPHDAGTIRRWTGPAQDVRVSPFFVDEAPRPREPEAEPPHILFVGGMSWFPNADGVLWFYDGVFGPLKKRHPSIVFDVVGSKPGPRLERLRSDRAVNLTGYVEDTRSYLDRAAVAVVPLRVGSGLRIKIIELLARGVPVVTTAVGCEGIPVTSGQELLIADGEEAFGAAVSRLLGDAEERRRLAASGVRFVRERYSFDAASAFYHGLFQ